MSYRTICARNANKHNDSRPKIGNFDSDFAYRFLCHAMESYRAHLSYPFSTHGWDSRKAGDGGVYVAKIDSLPGLKIGYSQDGWRNLTHDYKERRVEKTKGDVIAVFWVEHYMSFELRCHEAFGWGEWHEGAWIYGEMFEAWAVLPVLNRIAGLDPDFLPDYSLYRDDDEYVKKVESMINMLERDIVNNHMHDCVVRRYENDPLDSFALDMLDAFIRNNPNLLLERAGQKFLDLIDLKEELKKLKSAQTI